MAAQIRAAREWCSGAKRMTKTVVRFREQAEFLRESSGSNIEKTLLKAVKVLALFQIPHYVCGGFAVQEHGYPRSTVDVDIIVPDVVLAREKLCMNGFQNGVTDRETMVEVDLHPPTFSVPTQVSDTPQILTLESLVSSKLSTYMGRGIHRMQDFSDVVELIQANGLPREFPVASEVVGIYQQTWDALQNA
ncbi:MAG TPA: hypothetical protein VKG25_12295 [Bryobacteraceae bacterium]|nr:hypothetical protein [Bryobacteraceae bacterium]